MRAAGHPRQDAQWVRHMGRGWLGRSGTAVARRRSQAGGTSKGPNWGGSDDDVTG